MGLGYRRDYTIVVNGKQDLYIQSDKYATDMIHLFYPDAMFQFEVSGGCYKFYSQTEQKFIYVKWDIGKDI